MPQTAVQRKSDKARAMDGLRRLVKGLRLGDSKIQRAIGVSSAQLFVLRQLARRSGQSLSDLAASTLTTQSSISEVVSKLIAGGLVLKKTADDDHRRSELELTRRGRSVIERAPETPQERILGGLAALSPRTQQLLADGLEEWLEAADLGELAPTMFFEHER